MKMETLATPRDPSQPASHYRKLATALEQEIQSIEQTGVPALLFGATRQAFRLALALYSGGADTKEVYRWFDKAVSYELRATEARKYEFGGYGDAEFRFELYSAAFLIGRANELIRAFERSHFKEPLPEFLADLMKLFFSWLGEPPGNHTIADGSRLKTANKGWLLLSRLFEAVVQKDNVGYAKALRTYLEDYWGKEVDRSTKRTGGGGDSNYCGGWCILAAATSRRLVWEPDLSSDTRRYVPLDLCRPS